MNIEHSKSNFVHRHSQKIIAAGLVAALLILPETALASATGTSLPWETPLQTLKNSLTGPVAGVISILAFVVAGVGLVFGGEMNEFVRRAIMSVMAVALIVGASSILSTLFGAGALIALVG
jgi:type IV secretion system protein VirB2